MSKDKTVLTKTLRLGSWLWDELKEMGLESDRKVNPQISHMLKKGCADREALDAREARK